MAEGEDDESLGGDTDQFGFFLKSKDINVTHSAPATSKVGVSRQQKRMTLSLKNQ